MFNILGTGLKPITRKTESAGTDILRLVEPRDTADKAVVVRLEVTCGATAQTLSVMRPSAVAFADGAAEASQKDITLDEDPGSIASNDYIAVQLTDGSYQVQKVDSVAGLVVTCLADFSAAVEDGAKVFFFGAPADNHEQMAIAADGQTTYESDNGVFVANEPGYPILFHLTNATNAAVLDGGVVVYAQI
ncbi:MAG: hypothetical protein K9K80_02075 [Spirochaetia bacterium]|nr:hypothetical protein [Spirochaetia bacterium]